MTTFGIDCTGLVRIYTRMIVFLANKNNNITNLATVQSIEIFL